MGMVAFLNYLASVIIVGAAFGAAVTVIGSMVIDVVVHFRKKLTTTAKDGNPNGS